MSENQRSRRAAALDAAEEALGLPLPPGFRAMYLDQDGRYRSGGDWWVVWPLARLVSSTVDGWRSGTLSPGLIAFGDDGTGSPFCMRVDGRDEVVRWSWIDRTVETTEGGLDYFLMHWATDGE